MDKTLRTIREEIGANREGNVPLITLLVDTNILADYGWKRDDSVFYFFNTLVADNYDKFLVIAPKISKVEFKAITKQERTAWLNLKGSIEGKLNDISRYGEFKKLYNSLDESRNELDTLISSLDRSLHEVLEILSNLVVFFRRCSCLFVRQTRWKINRVRKQGYFSDKGYGLQCRKGIERTQ